MGIIKRIKNLKKQLDDLEDDDFFECDKDGKAIIEVGAENYDDIFSPYCYKGGDTLSSELVEYLNKQSGTISLDYDLNIRFNVKNADDRKRREIQMAVKENYEIEVLGIEQKLRALNIKGSVLIMIGALFMAIYLIMINFLSINFTYFVDILSWIFVWEGLSALMIDKNHLKTTELRLLRLASAKVTIKEFEAY